MPWLLVVGEREGLRWVLANQCMAFRHYVKGKPAVGDKFALYVSRGAFHNPSRDESQILALGSFLTGIQSGTTIVGTEEFPLTASLRFNRPVLAERAGLPFRPMVASMSFIKKKAGWAAYLRQTLVPLPEQDFATIKREFRGFASGSSR